MHDRRVLRRRKRGEKIADRITGYLDGQALPLWDCLPELHKIPRYSLVTKPTAVEAFPRLGEQIGYPDLWIKRDDQSASPYGGNKPRKLEFLLGRALAAGHQSLITVGGIGTNHGLATAIYAKQLGLETHLVLCGQPVTDHVRENLKLFHRFEANLHYARGFLGVALRVAGLYTDMARAQVKHPCGFIEPGGSSPVGNLGFVNAAFELADQVKNGLIPEPSYLFCAVGSGGTMAGLLVGLRLCRLSTRIIGVRVTDRLFANPSRVSHLANRTANLLKKYQPALTIQPFKSHELTILDGFFGAGYGSATPDARQAVTLTARHGILLESTYTGKAFAALSQFVKSLPKTAGPVLFWNTFNSHDLSPQARQIDNHALPSPFLRFFE